MNRYSQLADGGGTVDAWSSNLMMNSIIETVKVRKRLFNKKIKPIPITPEKSIF